MSMLATGGGSVKGGDTAAHGGSSNASSGTGNKSINIGGNPNMANGSYTIPLLIIGVVVAIYFLRKK